MEKHIEIGGKNYVLTSNRKIIKTIYEICPEVLNTNKSKKDENSESGIKLYADMDIVFYDMIKVAQPNITKAESDKIFDQFCEEYDGVDDKLMNFAVESFTGGNQGSAKKKKINW